MEKELGLQHSDTADSYNNIGVTYQNIGNYNKAIEYYNKALEVWEKVLEKEHPHTKIVLGNIESLSNYNFAEISLNSRHMYIRSL